MREYAKRTGRSESAVRKAVSEGRITKTADGKIDQEIADLQWAKNTMPAKSNGKPKVTGDHVTEYLEARARKEIANAMRAELDYEEAAGKLVQTERVSEYVAGFSGLVRDALTALPDRLAPGVAALQGEERAIRRVLAAEIDKTLRKMSKEIADLKI